MSKTYTTLGVAAEVFLAPEAGGCSGFVLAFPALDINPGHLAEVEARALDPFRGVQNPPACDPVRLADRAADIHRFLIGRHDYLFELRSRAGQEPVYGLKVGDFFRVMRGIYTAVGCFGPAEEGSEHETGLLDISTVIVIPFLRTTGTRPILTNPGRLHKAIIPLLDRIRQHVFDRPPVDRRGREPRFDIDAELPDALRGLALPSSLRRTIRYFYQDFARCLSDPFLFEGVLDLFDTFYTLHNLLCRVLPAAVAAQRSVRERAF